MPRLTRWSRSTKEPPVPARTSLCHITSHAFAKRVLLVCALLAMAVKALIPAGFMLTAAQPNQLIAVVICSQNTSQTLYMDQNGQLHASSTDVGKKSPNDHDDGSNGDHPCTFAGHSALALSQDFPAASDGPFELQASHFIAHVRDQVPGRGLAAPPPPATASPILI
jgi:hypothetical protein